MCIPARAKITWLLAAMFLAATGVGEGWHLLPGNGHLVELPGGYLLLGVRLPQAIPDTSGGGPAFDSGQRWSVPIEDDATCPICRLTGQGQSPAKAVHLVLAIPLKQGLPATSDSVPSAHVARPFDARAPPSA